MKSGYTHIAVVLDRSGSMWSVAADTIGGFNTFLAEQKELKGEATLTLVQFDSEFETVYFSKPLIEIPNLTSKTYIPRSGTALRDAVGKTILLTGKWLEEKPEEERPEKVICLILTDGGENESTEFSAEQIREMVKHQQDVYSWTFTFIGANQDSFAVSNKMGFSAANTMNYAATAAGTGSAFKSMSRGIVAARNADYATYNSTLRTEGLFDAEAYEEQTQLGVDNSARNSVK